MDLPVDIARFENLILNSDTAIVTGEQNDFRIEVPSPTYRLK